MTTSPQSPTHGSRLPRRAEGVSVQTRITATVALLVTVALAGAGLIVYAIESGRLDARNIAHVEQELDEFELLYRDGPQRGRRFASVEELLEVFIQSNVPDHDELLVGWVDGRPLLQSFPGSDLTTDPDFLAVVERLAVEGGSERLSDSGVGSARGDVLVTAQPVAQGDQRGALVILSFLDHERAELRSTLRTYTVVAILAVLFTCVVAGWLSGRLLSPLRVLRRTADEITATDLSRRLPVRGHDDITALTRTVNGMLDRLESAFVGQRRFLDDAGHELRTPLTVVSGHLELMDVRDPADVTATRDLVLGEVDRMSRLVRELLLLAKSDRPDFLKLEPVQVADLTHDVLTLATALGVRDWQVDEVADVEVTADGQRLTQALLQLCENAVKHTRPGATIALGSRQDDGQLRLWVRDTGPGVPPDQREQVFHRFARADARSSEEGFGLGLSIVRAIAVAHGGTARIEDADPPGALVVLDLPVRRRGGVPPGDRAAADRTQEIPTPRPEETRWPTS